MRPDFGQNACNAWRCHAQRKNKLMKRMHCLSFAWKNQVQNKTHQIHKQIHICIHTCSPKQDAFSCKVPPSSEAHPFAKRKECIWGLCKALRKCPATTCGSKSSESRSENCHTLWGVQLAPRRGKEVQASCCSKQC